MSVKTLGFGFAGVLVLALVGCAGGDAAQTDAAPTASAPAATSATPTPDATAESFPTLTDADLAGVFTDLQFVPDEFDDTSAMLNSIYPGLTTSDDTCLTPFGAGWDQTVSDGTVQFGTSGDRSMTAVVASAGDGDVASALVADSADALARCATGTDLFVMQGQPVQTKVEPFDVELTGADESVAFRVTGDVGGSAFTLVGMTVRVGGNVVALVGWDPATNESYVPSATQMFVDTL
ncbi:hypothetical protein BJQ94_14000 [Cryobacterium sp. SO2]|uniref:hypothetical protein n=1 Tax=Cryobacterium sp. SO2 TaxID=1897060 RepID=UPI0023DB620C|nr:hypothetical protein [Cryobacterium sp. SO2]WEO76470.1 hypothetical protein BJQ94_14000 [Cryobacterium sp. SO2]